MPPTETNNTQIDPQTLQNPEPKVEPPAQKKKSHLSFAIVIAFLLGAVVYASAAAVYKLTTDSAKSNEDMSQEESVSETPVQTPPINEDLQAVTSDELESYVDAAECNKTPEYGTLTAHWKLMKIETISLYEGIFLTNSSTDATVKWKTLPPVVDYECKDIKISDLKAGDRLNVYAASGVSPTTVREDVQLIQKASK